MPLYRASHDEAAALVARLESEGNTCTISSDDGGVYVVATPQRQARAKAEKETR